MEEELSKIAPVLEAAKAAVGGIKSDNLNEIRSLKMPPEAIRDVLEGVLRIMGNYDTSWISMKRYTSPLYLPYISPTSPLHLPYISRLALHVTLHVVVQGRVAW